MFGVTSVSANYADVARTSYGYVANYALECQTSAVIALRSSTRFVAYVAFDLELYSLVRIDWRNADVFQYLRSRIQQPPSVQYFRVSFFVAVVKRCVLLVEEPDIPHRVA